jgi:hypothetical protein
MISDDAKLVSSRHLVDIGDQVGGEETNVKSGKKTLTNSTCMVGLTNLSDGRFSPRRTILFLRKTEF